MPELVPIDDLFNQTKDLQRSDLSQSSMQQKDENTRMTFSESFFQTIQEIPQSKSQNKYPALTSGFFKLRKLIKSKCKGLFYAKIEQKSNKKLQPINKKVKIITIFTFLAKCWIILNSTEDIFSYLTLSYRKHFDFVRMFPFN